MAERDRTTKVIELRAALDRGELTSNSPPRNEQEPDLPPVDPKDRPQDEYLDGRDMRFHGYKIETLEQGGEYPDTMPQAIEVTDAEGRKTLYVPLSRDGNVVHSAPLIDALKRCGAIK
ncbi:MAG: hypothetical protein V7634_4630 [Bradyrhizobium sp.]|jgi:hypothetical protein